MNLSTSSACTFPADEAGRLYDPDVRAITQEAAHSRAMEAMSAIRLVAKQMHDEMTRWADGHGLSEGRMQVLIWLRKFGQVSLGDLAERLEVTPRNVTGLIDHLEADGLVERVPDPQDRRSTFARLTAAGQERVATAWKDATERQWRATSNLSPEELEELRHLCLKVADGIRKAEEKR